MAHDVYADWAYEVIDAERSDLPPTIKAIKADRLDKEALARAEAFFRTDQQTQNVQIEIPVCDSLRDFSASFRDTNKIQSVEMDLRAEVGDGLKFERLHNIYNRFARRDVNNAALLEEWHSLNLNMVQSADAVWPGCFLAFVSWTDDVVSNWPLLQFHLHAGEYFGASRFPGFYLNFPQSTIGTVFKDPDKRVVWVSKGWSYNLFATRGHDNIVAAMHSPPSIDMMDGPERRYTSITKIYPVGRDGAPVPY